MRTMKFLIIILLLMVSGCVANEQSLTEQSQPANKFTETAEPIRKTNTIIMTNTPTIIESVVSPEPEIYFCSPLTEYPSDKLINLISNPYNPPPEGSDDPHQGVDFSIVDPDP